LNDFLKIYIYDKPIGCIQTNFTNDVTDKEMKEINEILANNIVNIAKEIKNLGYKTQINWIKTEK